MGKLKLKEKQKFDRSVEISSPILDPEIVRAIHSPHEPDLRHGGFKVLLSHDNQGGQQLLDTSGGGGGGNGGPRRYGGSTDELTPMYEVNHTPSYIGISCAVSGYTNYGSQLLCARRPLDDSTNTARSESNLSKVSTSRLTSTPTPNRELSRTSSPAFKTPIISHFKLDKSKLANIEQERRELVGLMAASISEKHPCGGDSSPIPPTESDRHHGAYVGARYSPMPDPAEPVPKHIPLLGIDDELDPEEAAAAATAASENHGRVKRVASLYGLEEAQADAEAEAGVSKQEGAVASEPQSETVRL